MPRYVVEQRFPEGLPPVGTDCASRLWRTVTDNNTEEGVTWLHSYVSQDRKRAFCICDGPSPEAIRRAAQRNGLPVSLITEVRVLDPYFFH
jgi:Protein of unknown function (DUF4242)